MFIRKLFEEAELKILQSINNKFKDITTQEMIDLSHEEIGWQQNFDNPHQPIDYLYAFELKN
ncbi:MAG: type II toxin-antitoxin system antitoxin SocA domain-containing protein [Proteiniphilum sp.]